MPVLGLESGEHNYALVNLACGVSLYIGTVASCPDQIPLSFCATRRFASVHRSHSIYELSGFIFHEGAISKRHNFAFAVIFSFNIFHRDIPFTASVIPILPLRSQKQTPWQILRWMQKIHSRVRWLKPNKYHYENHTWTGHQPLRRPTDRAIKLG
ncbi:hypothetical protein ACMFMG_010621 [Clarireedia jacksonii]